MTRAFDGFATGDAPSDARNIGLHVKGPQFGACEAGTISWQSQRTEYLTAGSEVAWTTSATVWDKNSEEEAVNLESVDSYEPGPSERVTGKAPLGLNVAGEQRYMPLVRKGDRLYMSLPYMDSSDIGESIFDAHKITGTAVVKRDGEEVAKTDLTSPDAEFGLPAGDAGDYTLSAQVSHPDSYTPLATETTVEWAFASKPVDEVTPLDISTVGFDAEGVSDGYADAGNKVTHSTIHTHGLK